MSDSRNYNHPYTPYDIQLQLMRSIYYDLLSSESSKIGFFESPTGTGKTLSLICSVMSYIRDVKVKYLLHDLHDKKLSDGGSFSDSDDEPGWVTESYENGLKVSKITPLEQFENKIEHYNVRNLSNLDSKPVKRRRLNVAMDTGEGVFGNTNNNNNSNNNNTNNNNNSNNNDDDDSFLISNDTIESEIQDLLKRINDPSKKDTVPTTTGQSSSFVNEYSKIARQPLKIIFASRTHSQLQQFSEQLRKVNFQSSFKDEKGNIAPLLSKHERVKLLPIGSKRQLCCNSSVNTVAWTMDKINDKCQELRKDSKCGYFKNLMEKDSNVQESTGFPPEMIYKDILDIEELNEVGQEIKKCPYYGIKPLAETAEIITLPYQLLFMEDLSIDLSNSIVIVDEAHNLVSTLLDMSKCEIKFDEIECLLKGVTIYLDKFGKKLAPKNKVNILKIKRLLNQLLEYFKKDYAENKTTDLLPFLSSNNNSLISFMKNSNLAQKLQSYMLKENVTTVKAPILFKLIKFLSILTNNKTTDGVWYYENNKLNYLPFEPTRTVANIVSKCYKMILIGGTMQPFNQFDIVFSENEDIYKNQSLKLELGHVIPKSNIQCHIVSKFKFTKDNRSSPQFMTRIGEYLIGLLKNIPKGCIIFCQSYAYLSDLLGFWQSQRKNIWNELNLIKKVFKEDANESNGNVFTQYCKHIESGAPAVLFAVFGGKLSEGINFEDDLARGVICLGIPYPNIFTFEMSLMKAHLKEKFNGYIDSIVMRQVNQSVGRSIRHASDYASIILIDERFTSPNIMGKLSKWVRDSVENKADINEELEKFFVSKSKVE